MTVNIGLPEIRELHPKIIIMGVGGAGGNAVNNMIAESLEGVDFVVANTDAQALDAAAPERRIQLGCKLTKGLGAGSDPKVGCAAAEESISQIAEHLTGAHMVFITAGMGGGTGTGAAPVVARVARELGVLAVGVVTKPFQFEGAKRTRLAERGIEELRKHVDTLIVIPNQNLFRIATEKTTFADAFAMADNVLHSGVRGITDLIVRPGLINLDFADVKAVIDEMGMAMMGTGEAEGEKRAIEAAESAISNPLLEDVSLKGASGLLISITHGDDITLFEIDEAANRIRSEVDPDANIIVGSTHDTSLEGRIRVSVFATGIEAEQSAARPAILVRADEIATAMEAEPIAAEAVLDAPEGIPAVAEEQAEQAKETVVATPATAPAEQASPGHRVERREAVFLPPAPMRADGIQVAALTPEPYAEAALTNGARSSRPDDPRRGPSLVQRMRRAKRNKDGADGAGVAPAGEAMAAPVLGKLDPGDRIDQKLALEDQFEIPAFLRRQAN